MAKIIGGILGRVSGKTSGVVFSQARGRIGKLNTVREYVVPANPQTTEQVLQRSIFKRSLIIVKGWGPDMYQTDFNRAVQQLPGFQSCMSVILSNVDEAGDFETPPDIPLGDLHFPDTFTVEAGASAGDIDVTWSTELGSNGTSADLVKCVCYAVSSTSTKQHAICLTPFTRTDGSTGITFSGLDAGDSYIVGMWLCGVGSAEGFISKCSFDSCAAKT